MCVVALPTHDVLLIMFIWNNDVTHDDTQLYTCISYVIMVYIRTFLCDNVLTLNNFNSKTFNVNQAWMVNNVVICIQHAIVLQLVTRDVDDTC